MNAKKSGRVLKTSGMYLMVLTVILFFCSNWVNAGPPPIKIGIVQSISGMVSEYGLDDVEGFKTKIEEVNAKGGVQTKDGLRKIELIVRDDKLKPDIAVQNGKSLIFEDKCDFLVGCISSSSALALSQWAKENKVLLWIWDARAHDVTGTKGHRYVFRSSGNTWMNGHAAANYFKDKPYTKWALLSPDYAYGRDQAVSFIDGMKAAKPGFTVVTEQWPKLGTTDYTPFITALMSAKPEALYTSLWGTDAMTFIKQAKGYGLFSAMKVVGLFWGTPLLRPMGGEMVEGVYVLTEAPYEYPGSAENKVFYDTYKAKTGKYPSDYSVLGYNAATFIVAGIEKAGTAATEPLIDALEGISIKTIAPSKTITIRKCDHQSDYGIVVGTTVKDPQWPWFLLKEITVIPGGPTMPSCQQIEAERAAAK